MGSLLWDEIKAHISPSEVDNYARQIGLARISRNEEVQTEFKMLLMMHNTIQTSLTDEISKKNPLILESPQRSSAIARAIHFLVSLRERGDFIDPSDACDSQIIKYLKFSRLSRPGSAEQPPKARELATGRATRSVGDVAQSIADIQSLLDDEYAELQTKTQELRCSLFSTCDDLAEVKSIEPPPTSSIESFNKRVETKDFVAKSMAKVSGSSVSRLRASVALNRMWE
jgi:hypothetical protein